MKTLFQLFESVKKSPVENVLSDFFYDIKNIIEGKPTSIQVMNKKLKNSKKTMSKVQILNDLYEKWIITHSPEQTIAYLKERFPEEEKAIEALKDLKAGTPMRKGKLGEFDDEIASKLRIEAIKESKEIKLQLYERVKFYDIDLKKYGLDPDFKSFKDKNILQQYSDVVKEKLEELLPDNFSISVTFTRENALQIRAENKKTQKRPEYNDLDSLRYGIY